MVGKSRFFWNSGTEQFFLISRTRIRNENEFSDSYTRVRSAYTLVLLEVSRYSKFRQHEFTEEDVIAGLAEGRKLFLKASRRERAKRARDIIPGARKQRVTCKRVVAAASAFAARRTGGA